MKLVLIFAAAICLAGCATSPTESKNARQVPPENIYAKDLLKPAGKAIVPVTVTRDEGFVGVAFGDTLRVNGRDIAKFAAGERLTFYLPPGAVVFAVVKPMFNNETGETIVVGQPQKFRIASSPSGAGPQLTRTMY